MAQRKEILNQLKEDFEKIQVSEGYNTDVAEIKRGLHKYMDCPNKPCIVFNNLASEKVTDTFGAAAFRNLRIIVSLYMDLDYEGNYDAFDNFIADVQKFLYSTDNTNYSETEIETIEIWEGGITEPFGICDMQIVIGYYYEVSNP